MLTYLLSIKEAQHEGFPLLGNLFSGEEYH